MGRQKKKKKKFCNFFAIFFQFFEIKIGCCGYIFQDNLMIFWYVVLKLHILILHNSVFENRSKQKKIKSLYFQKMLFSKTPKKASKFQKKNLFSKNMWKMRHFKRISRNGNWPSYFNDFFFQKKQKKNFHKESFYSFFWLIGPPLKWKVMNFDIKNMKIGQMVLELGYFCDT